MAAVKASAVSCPTPGIVVKRRQTSEARTIRLISASMAMTAASMAARAPIGPRMAADSPVIPLARTQSLLDERRAERPRQSHTEHDGKAADLVLCGRAAAHYPMLKNSAALSKRHQRAPRRMFVFYF